jgi:hypothetical protein
MPDPKDSQVYGFHLNKINACDSFWLKHHSFNGHIKADYSRDLLSRSSRAIYGAGLLGEMVQRDSRLFNGETRFVWRNLSALSHEVF